MCCCVRTDCTELYVRRETEYQDISQNETNERSLSDPVPFRMNRNELDEVRRIASSFYSSSRTNVYPIERTLSYLFECDDELFVLFECEREIINIH